MSNHLDPDETRITQYLSQIKTTETFVSSLSMHHWLSVIVSPEFIQYWFYIGHFRQWTIKSRSAVKWFINKKPWHSMNTSKLNHLKTFTATLLLPNIHFSMDLTKIWLRLTFDIWTIQLPKHTRSFYNDENSFFFKTAVVIRSFSVRPFCNTCKATFWILVHPISKHVPFMFVKLNTMCQTT